MNSPQGTAAPAPTPEDCRRRREALGLTPYLAARRTGLTVDAILRFEAGQGGLTAEQVAVLIRALGAAGPTDPQPGPRRMLDFGLIGTLVFLLGGAIPAAMAVITGFNALRFIAADDTVAEVVGFERRIRVAEPATGERYNFETVAPLLRFRRPDGGGEVTIAWRSDTLPHEAGFTVGDRIWVVVPRGAPERFELSLASVVLTPLLCLGLAAPLLGIGAVSLRHMRRRRSMGP